MIMSEKCGAAKAPTLTYALPADDRFLHGRRRVSHIIVCGDVAALYTRAGFLARVPVREVRRRFEHLAPTSTIE